ncbi:MAG: phosphoenolpyruvate--protein phosphotransferase [Burkholderiaceae bacterium]|jgi:phosphotransferase system enzyme I (PtsI)
MAWMLSGVGIGDGLAMGRAWVLASARLDLPRRRLEPDQVEPELKRFREAVSIVNKELADLKEAMGQEPSAEVSALLELQAIILRDPLLVAATEQRIESDCCNAEWGLLQQLEAVSAQFDEIDDPYLRERKADVQQIVDRILRAMQGDIGLEEAVLESHSQDDDGWILVAKDISPADMLILRRHRFLGFVTETGSATSHTAILARSLGLPAVVGVSGLLNQIAQNDIIVLRSDEGSVLGALTADDQSVYKGQQALYADDLKALEDFKQLASCSLDGVSVLLMANIDLPDDVQIAIDRGCDGIGLFRSEFLFMNRSTIPSEDEQFQAYSAVVKAMGGRPVTIRTLDAGADKEVTALSIGHDRPNNPALASRAIRYSLQSPDLFLSQLRAMLRASAFGQVKILIPMVSGPSEMISAREMVQQAMTSLRAKGLAFNSKVSVGAMIEVPSAAIAIDGLIAHMDFASIGTNDLIQYTLAIDRTDRSVAHLYNPLHPAILRLIDQTIRSCNRANLPVSLCGEMAGDIDFTRLLLGLGLREFSMHATEILKVKRVVRSSSVASLSRGVGRLLKLPDPALVKSGLSAINAKALTPG